MPSEVEELCFGRDSACLSGNELRPKQKHGQDALLSCASGVCLSIDLAVWSQQRRLDTCDCLVYEFRKSQRLVRNHYETRTVYRHLGHSRAKDAGKVKSNVWSTI